MGWQWLLVVLGLLQPVLLTALVPRRWLGRAMLAWIVLPILGVLVVAGSGLANRDLSGNPGDLLLFTFWVLNAGFALAWTVGSGLAFALGLSLRRRLRPGEPPLRAPWRRAPPTSAHPRRPAWSPGAPAGARMRSLLSPDQRICVGIAEVEWAAGQWVRTPRVEDRMTRRAVLDLWGSDWDAEVRFPGPGQVWLGLRAYGGGGAWALTLDLRSGMATLRAVDSHGAAAQAGPIGTAAARLEQAAAATLASRAEADGIAPPRFAAWRSALAILVAALATIAALVALTPAPPPQKLDPLPSFTPPSIPEPPRVSPVPR